MSEEKKKRGPGRKETKKHLAAALLLDSGLSDKQVAETLGYSVNSMESVKNRIKRKGLDQFLTKRRVTSATKTVDALMVGQPVGEITVVKDSTALAAAAMVLDRAYPKQVDSGPQVQNSFTVVNLNFASLPTSQSAAPQTIEIPAQNTSGNTPEIGG